MRFLNLLFFFFGTIAFNQAQTIQYVNPAATGNNTGVDWTNAFTDLHTALQNVQAGDQIWVASGIYHTSVTNDRSIYFELKSGVKLYGSFAGTENNLDERNIPANPTIFDGDIGDAGDSTDNTYNLMYLPFPDSNTVVDGFVFKNALADDQTQQADQLGTSGSALFINGFNAIAYPKISNCIFKNNTSLTAGGAIYIIGGGTGSVAPRFVQCHFVNNKSILSDGGAIFKRGNSNIEFKNDFLDCQFEFNFAFQRGGGIYFSETNLNDTLNIQKCIFNKNTAAKFGGAIYISGRSSGTLINVDSVDFLNNQAKIGAGIYFYSTTIIKLIILSKCSFSGNNPYPLGSSTFAPDFHFYNDDILVHTGRVLLKECAFLAPDYFIANEMVGSFKVEVENCLFENASELNVLTLNSINFINNIFIGSKSPLVLQGNSNDSKQITVFNNIFCLNNLRLNIYPNAIVSGNVFFNNKTNQLFGFQNIDTLSNILYNNIFYKNTGITQPGYQLCNNANTALNNNLFYDFPDCSIFPSLASCLSGNLFAVDPMFVDTAVGDFRLLPCSPAINAGFDSLYAQLGILTDFAGNPRILDGQSDIGAMESLSLSASTDPVVDPTCINANNGSATFNIVGGCEPYSFAWSSEAGTTGSDTTELAAGTYHFTITDQQGKTYEQTLVVDETQAIQIGNDITKATCGACPDGSIQVQPLTGAEPFVYLWNNGDTSASLQGLLPGIYTLTVIDAWGCDQVFAYTVDFFIGTAEPGWNDGCTVSPNPVVDVAVFRMNQGLFNGQRIRVTDELGREVHTGIAYGSAYTWRPSGLPGGWYVWHVVEKSGRQMDSGRIIIP